MDIRQAGVDMDKLLHLMGHNRLAQRIIRDAYKSEQLFDEKLRDGKSFSFSIDWYLKCYEATYNSVPL
jgi:hypothetical protein